MIQKTTTFFSLMLFLTSNFVIIFAQAYEAPPPTPRPPMVRGTGSGNGLAYGGAEEDDDGKLTGATIRGKVVYEDSGRPLRFVAIGFIKSGEEGNTYSTKFVKTDENGDFVIKNIKPGTFLPIIKSDGILNPTSYVNQLRQPEKKAEIENLFEKTEVAGLGEFQVLIRAKRGGSVSGRVYFADGEVAVGVKVEALIKNNNQFQQTSYGDFSVGTTTTDDRGFYRFAGLPEGKYIVRVTEPVSHKETKMQLWEARGSYGQESQMLTTYYPDAEKSDKATQLEVGIGQEQTDINVNLPERKLFRISGKVIAKQNQLPLKDFNLVFVKINEPDKQAEKSDTVVLSYQSGMTVKTDSAGNWAVRSLLKGKYQVRITQGYVYKDPKLQTNEKTVSYPSVTKDIEITDKDIADIAIEIPSEASISGIYLTENGQPLPQEVYIYASTEDGKGFGSSSYYAREKEEIEKQRTFSISKLIAGKYKIYARNQSFYIKSIKVNGSDVSNTFLELKEGEEIKNVQIVLSNQMGTLKGKIDNYDPKDQTAVFLIKYGVKYDEIRSESQSVGVNTKGEFQIKTKEGEYSVLLIRQSTFPKTEQEIKQWVEKELKDAPKVEIKIGEISNITLKIPDK